MNKITHLSKTLNEFFNKKADNCNRFYKKKVEWLVICKSLGNIGVKNCSIDKMYQLLNEDSGGNDKTRFGF